MKTPYVVFALGLLLFFGSCKKNQLGGKSTVRGQVAHHEKMIPFARVFIKFNAKEFPGSDTSIYDSRITTGADASYTFNCYKGDYYLYAFGYDDAILKNVKGGLPLKVRTNENITANLAVTED
ncbi:MAG: hypothetical protein PSX36_14365 [bacterium]|nr:hypothetical protein [bacterium]